jgi:hypothetical protein
VKKYIRAWPKPEYDFSKQNDGSSNTGSKPREGSLRIEREWKLGSGSHSLVFRTCLQFPDLVAESLTGEAVVAAKLSFDSSEDREMLSLEGKSYANFPKYLSEHWSGYHYFPNKEFDGNGIVPIPPVLPKFYGYYIPEGGDLRKACAILLLEECGEPVVTEKLTPEQR